MGGGPHVLQPARPHRVRVQGEAQGPPLPRHPRGRVRLWLRLKEREQRSNGGRACGNAATGPPRPYIRRLQSVIVCNNVTRVNLSKKKKKKKKNSCFFPPFKKKKKKKKKK